MQRRQPIDMIAALDQNRVIGCGNAVPWHLPNDLAYFKQTTMGKPVLMGRITFQSIGRPLPGRRNLILSRDRRFSAQGCEVFDTIPAVLANIAPDVPLMVIGGATIYAQMLSRATRLYLTHIDHAFEGDAYFPTLDPKAWEEISSRRLPADKHNRYSSTQQELQRRG